jgi:hypothetical protein
MEIAVWQKLHHAFCKVVRVRVKARASVRA